MLQRNWLIVLALMLTTEATAWCDDVAPSLPAAGAADRLVAQLNSDDYAVREDAARQLREAGAAAIEALVEGLASDQAEVAWRCGAALEQIGLEGDDATVEQIVKSLDAACAKTGRQGLKTLAKELDGRQKQFRRQRAVAQIRKHGGQIAGSELEGEDVVIDEAILPFAGPAVVFDPPFVEIEGGAAVPFPAEEAAPALPRAEIFDLFAEVGRLLGRAVAPRGAEPAEDVASPVERAVEAPAKDAAKALDEAKQSAEDAKQAVERAIEEAADVPLEGSKPAPIEEAKVIEVAHAEVAPALMLADVGFVGPAVAVDADVESDHWAQLALDTNWTGGDDGLAALKDLPELTQISLQQTKLTDKALVHLAKLPKLQQLNLYRAGFSRDALLRYHGQRPNVVVYARGDAMMGINGDLHTSPLVLTTIQVGSGAAKAGLQEGDIVHQIDGVKIRDFSDLTICVSTKKPGDRIEVEYERAGKKHTVQISLTRRSE